VVLVSHVGENRQLSNAGAVLLYQDEAGRRIPPHQLHLVRDTKGVAQKVYDGVRKVLERSHEATQGREILGTVIPDPSSLPTIPLILLHEKETLAAFRGAIHSEVFETRAIGKLRVAYVRGPDDSIVRLIVASVGSSGLYGDTAGHFVDAMFDPALVPNLIPHVLFSATAGGLSRTDSLEAFTSRGVKGLGVVEPGGFLFPRRAVIDELGSIPHRTLLDCGDTEHVEVAQRQHHVEEMFRQAGVLQYDRHYSIRHPAEETFDQIDRLVVEHLIASLDVEGGPIARAVERGRARLPHATFNPFYIFSDDPRRGRDDAFKTLAFGGPLSDNSKAPGGTKELIRRLFDLACVVEKVHGR